VGKKSILLLLVGAFATGLCQAQPNLYPSGVGQTAAVQKFTSPAPTTASLGNFGNIPTDLNAGVATVSIPVVELKGRQLSVPVSLNYRTTGVRVNEMASWVGLGWVLNAGGTITRTVRGLPDESLKGYHSTLAANAIRVLHGRQTESCREGQGFNYSSGLSDTCTMVLTGQVDTEPDVFSYNFAGYSGTIFFRQNQEPMLVPPREWVITRTDFDYQATSAYPLRSSIAIRTEDGTNYLFGAQEATFDDPDGPGHCAITAWHLSSMSAADGSDQIDIEYQGDSASAFNTETRSIKRIKVSLPGNQGNCPTGS
jgi:hypothetical protein